MSTKPEAEFHGERRGWHIDKSISVSTIVAALVAGGSVFIWGSGVNQRLAVHDTEILSTREQLKTSADENSRARGEIRADLQEINRKIDRLIERPTSK